jgi:N-methylhydantoinase B
MTVETFRNPATGRRTRESADTDPVTTEVIRHGLSAAADQMQLALVRTAFSPVIYEITDFAAALYDDQVRLLAQGRSVPLFLGTLSFCIEAAVEKSGGRERLEPGDVIVTTEGYDTGAHPQDLTIVVPGFFGDVLVGFAAIKAHHLDIGAKEIYCTDTTDVFQEGTIFPSVKLHRRGELQDDLYRTLLANSRLPHALAGDLNAQIGATRTGLEALNRIIERHGLERFRDSVEHMFDHGEAMMRGVLESIPDGRYVGAGAMDNNGIDDELVPFDVAVEVQGSDVTVDFSNASPTQAGPINCPLPTTVSAARLAIMAFAGGRELANEGFFRPLQVRTRRGTMFHPHSPAPIYMYFWPAMQAVDVIHLALAEAMPERVTAGNGGDHGFIAWWGSDADGAFWGDAMDHIVGQGATQDRDGSTPLMHIAASCVRHVPAEVWEARRPFVVEKFELAPDSGGTGRFRGGLGIDIHYRALRDCQVTIAWDRTRTSPAGLYGGGPARPMRCGIRYPDGTVVDYPKITGLRVPAGAVLEVHTGGGGGFGLAAQRDPDAVRADLLEGLISEAAARRVYPHAFS